MTDVVHHLRHRVAAACILKVRPALVCLCIKNQQKSRGPWNLMRLTASCLLPYASCASHLLPPASCLMTFIHMFANSRAELLTIYMSWYATLPPHRPFF
jgi:hypothetical protein